MEPVDEKRRGWAAAWASLGTACVFEALTVPATQDKAVWAASPWREDPYHTVVSVAQFAVPMLALVIVIRLLAWRAPGGPERTRQTVRAAAAMTALVGLTLASEWAAVLDRTSASSRETMTWALIVGLVLTSALTVAVTALLVRCRGRRGSSGRWRHDWLDDVVFVCRRIPLLRRLATPDAAAWARRRAMTVFVALSVLAAAPITGAQAIGEHVTDPLLITWLLIAVTASNLAFCVLSNAVAGFIARPPRTRRRRVAEASVIAGCVGILVAIAFHDALWSLLGTKGLTPPALAVLTLGAGLATSLVAVAVLVACVSGATARRYPDADRP